MNEHDASLTCRLEKIREVKGKKIWCVVASVLCERGMYATRRKKGKVKEEF